MMKSMAAFIAAPAALVPIRMVLAVLTLVYKVVDWMLMQLWHLEDLLLNVTNKEI
jgi:hypothetical protein